MRFEQHFQTFQSDVLAEFVEHLNFIYEQAIMFDLYERNPIRTNLFLILTFFFSMRIRKTNVFRLTKYRIINKLASRYVFRLNLK